jgi:hypothetical protein
MEFVALFFVGTTVVLLAAHAIDALKRQEPVHISRRWRMLHDARRVRNGLSSFNAAANDMWPDHERQPHKRASSRATAPSDL